MAHYKVLRLWNDRLLASGASAGGGQVLHAFPTAMTSSPRFKVVLDANVDARSASEALTRAIGSLRPDCSAAAGFASVFQANTGVMQSQVNRPLAAVESGKRIPAARMIVLLNAIPGRELEFERWHFEQHFPDLLRMPGWIRTQRFIRIDTAPYSEACPSCPWRYLVIYELRAPDIAAAVDFAYARFGGPEMPSSDALDAENMIANVYVGGADASPAGADAPIAWH